MIEPMDKREEIEVVFQGPTESIWDALQRLYCQLKASLLANQEKEAEIARLRSYLIQAGREAGALFTDTVSTEFLRHVPEEINLKLASLRASVGGEKWIDVKQELPPVDVWVMGWLFLPKNPPASGCSIAQFTGCKRDEPESFGRVRMTVDCWWANGIYYPSGHFTHWQPLPAPPTLPTEKES